MIIKVNELLSTSCIQNCAFLNGLIVKIKAFLQVFKNGNTCGNIKKKPAN